MQISFCGATGTEYGFDQVDIKTDWINEEGIALLVAPDSYGWRVIRVLETTACVDIDTLSALAEARHYGARAVFVRSVSSTAERQRIICDLEAGLTPVISNQPIMQARAA